MKKCEIPDIIIGLAITIGEIINGRGEKRGPEKLLHLGGLEN